MGGGVNELALFAGAGGGILGGLLHGWRTVCAVEIEDYPRRVLLQRQADGILPRFPVWDDVCTFDGRPWRGRVDVISGGFPCQDISTAGRGEGITGARSGLWGDMARIVSEVYPLYVFIENSPLLVGRGLALVLCDLAGMGYDARWGVVGAHHAGAIHKRDRCWVLAHSGKVRSQFEASHKRVGGGRSSVSDSVAVFRQSIDWSGCGTGRKVNGVAHRVDRLKAIGNGQVPVVAAIAWDLLGPGDTGGERP
jgi:DNA (cytosine-5)-methyltransferase 1